MKLNAKSQSSDRKSDLLQLKIPTSQFQVFKFILEKKAKLKMKMKELILLRHLRFWEEISVNTKLDGVVILDQKLNGPMSMVMERMT
jgi:hypothetical protein